MAGTEPRCSFCSTTKESPLPENSLAFVIKDNYPVTDWHVLVVPRRHVADYFELGTAEARAGYQLVAEARALLLGQDKSILGFNVGINDSAVAGQTVMHCHIHLIPLRAGDSPNPRRGVRCVIPGKANYTTIPFSHMVSCDVGHPAARRRRLACTFANERSMMRRYVAALQKNVVIFGGVSQKRPTIIAPNETGAYHRHHGPGRKLPG